ncbi:MAG: hypothetical protein WAU88_00935 [Candidatus Zixiibacteriota bacterium]
MNAPAHIPDPAVSRRTLMLSAAFVWGAVGLMLSIRGAFWFESSQMTVWWMIVLALAIGLVKGRYIFGKLAKRNIQRIRELSPQKEKICIFAFQAMQSYFLIIGMVTLGFLLRWSPLPRELLAVIYLAIGAGLMYASGEYWRG